MINIIALLFHPTITSALPVPSEYSSEDEYSEGTAQKTVTIMIVLSVLHVYVYYSRLIQSPLDPDRTLGTMGNLIKQRTGNFFGLILTNYIAGAENSSFKVVRCMIRV
jgi:hypothetical protein